MYFGSRPMALNPFSKPTSNPFQAMAPAAAAGRVLGVRAPTPAGGFRRRDTSSPRASTGDGLCAATGYPANCASKTRAFAVLENSSDTTFTFCAQRKQRRRSWNPPWRKSQVKSSAPGIAQAQGRFSTAGPSTATIRSRAPFAGVFGPAATSSASRGFYRFGVTAAAAPAPSTFKADAETAAAHATSSAARDFSFGGKSSALSSEAPPPATGRFQTGGDTAPATAKIGGIFGCFGGSGVEMSAPLSASTFTTPQPSVDYVCRNTTACPEGVHLGDAATASDLAGSEDDDRQEWFSVLLDYFGCDRHSRGLLSDFASSRRDASEAGVDDGEASTTVSEGDTGADAGAASERRIPLTEEALCLWVARGDAGDGAGRYQRIDIDDASDERAASEPSTPARPERRLPRPCTPLSAARVYVWASGSLKDGGGSGGSTGAVGRLSDRVGSAGEAKNGPAAVGIPFPEKEAGAGQEKVDATGDGIVREMDMLEGRHAIILIDLETTGIAVKSNRVIQLAAKVRVRKVQ